MRTQRSIINTADHDIPCKWMFPDDDRVSGFIVGVHGFGGSKESSTQTRLAEDMTSRGFAYVCFDLPAHGESTEKGKKLTVERCIADLVTVARLAERRFPRAARAVFATSFGGFVTLNCLDRLRDYKIILRAPAVTMPEVFLGINEMTAEQFKEKDSIWCGFEHLFELKYSFYEDLCAHRLPESDLGREMLVFHGSADSIVPPEDVRDFCRRNPLARLEIIDGADHCDENPEQLDFVIRNTRDYLLS